VEAAAAEVAITMAYALAALARRGKAMQAARGGLQPPPLHERAAAAAGAVRQGRTRRKPSAERAAPGWQAAFLARQ
jgi:hypothetical protein